MELTASKVEEVFAACQAEAGDVEVDAIVGLLVGPLFALLGAFLLLGTWINWREGRAAKG